MRAVHLGKTAIRPRRRSGRPALRNLSRTRVRGEGCPVQRPGAGPGTGLQVWVGARRLARGRSPACSTWQQCVGRSGRLHRPMAVRPASASPVRAGQMGPRADACAGDRRHSTGRRAPPRGWRDKGAPSMRGPRTPTRRTGPAPAQLCGAAVPGGGAGWRGSRESRLSSSSGSTSKIRTTRWTPLTVRAISPARSASRCETSPIR